MLFDFDGDFRIGAEAGVFDFGTAGGGEGEPPPVVGDAQSDRTRRGSAVLKWKLRRIS